MKRNVFTLFILMIAAAVVLGACGNKPERQEVGSTSSPELPANVESPKYEGYVVSKTNDSILVVSAVERDFSANGGMSHYYEAIWFSNSPPNVEVGHKVEVLSTGAIAESYPAQGKADTVAVIEPEKPEGAILTEAEAIRQALLFPEIAELEYMAAVIKEVTYTAESSEWSVFITRSGEDKVLEIKVADQALNQGSNQGSNGQVPEPSDSDHALEELGDSPPMPVVNAGDLELAVHQGSYCWTNANRTESVCADTFGPVEVFKDKPIQLVRASELIEFHFQVAEQPNQFHLTRIQGSEMTEEKLSDPSFRAPEEPGVYYYALTAYWQNDIASKTSKGSASYFVAIEVAES